MYICYGFTSMQLIPCALLSLVIHPTASKNSWSGIAVAFCSYLNSISLLPQLQVIRKRESVDRVTAQYMFWLGCARLVYVENWIIEILLTRGQSVTFLGYDFVRYDNIWWAVMGVLSEIVNGFILADYCYYYMTFDFDVEREDMHLPSGVV
ncbi:ER lumen protein-retaining receptor-like [Corylus avellana]|uniref:ER lumen protein-retaining receptor-like n=1 Tax=Corylus avellana TaxID=13451 RepID=UPI00286A5A36|nr:ER lumen protein-retaining receptor-like [Corylus avellana]